MRGCLRLGFFLEELDERKDSGLADLPHAKGTGVRTVRHIRLELSRDVSQLLLHIVSRLSSEIALGKLILLDRIEVPELGTV